MLFFILNIIILLLVPFLTIGIIKKTKAFWSGRKGVSIVQPLWDFLRLLRKDSVYSKTTTQVFKFAPVVMLASVLFAALFVPLADGVAIINVPFAFVIFAYALGFGKFFSLLAAIDTGSSFEGMGASREACFSTIVEPAFFILMGSVSVFSYTYNFDSFKSILSGAGVYGYLIILMSALTLFVMLLIEGCRVPVDDPNTHLELTMIHEVMILDNSGVDLALITWGAGIKIFLFEALISNLVLSSVTSIGLRVALFLVLVVLISMLVGTIESMIARFRMTHVFEFIFIMTLTALLVLALVTFRIYGN